jgi:hypothetical protein
MLKKLLHGREVSECVLFTLQSGDTSEADLLAAYLNHRRPNSRSLLLLAGNSGLLSPHPPPPPPQQKH